MNLQIAATLSGRIAAIGPIPVHGARHDARAFAASGLRRRPLPRPNQQIRRDARSRHRAVLFSNYYNPLLYKPPSVG